MDAADAQYVTQPMLTCIGNKRRLLDFVGTGVERVKQHLQVDKLRMMDACCGSTVVARTFMAHASELLTNDLEQYSYIMQQCVLLRPAERRWRIWRGRRRVGARRGRGRRRRAGRWRRRRNDEPQQVGGAAGAHRECGLAGAVVEDGANALDRIECSRAVRAGASACRGAGSRARDRVVAGVGAALAALAPRTVLVVGVVCEAGAGCSVGERRGDDGGAARVSGVQGAVRPDIVQAIRDA